MAQIILPIASFNNGEVEVSLRYNDANLAINQFSVVNNSNYPCQVMVKKAGVEAMSIPFSAHSETTRNVQGIAFVMEDIGDDDGVARHMGDVEIYCRWPA